MEKEYIRGRDIIKKKSSERKEMSSGIDSKSKVLPGVLKTGIIFKLVTNIC